jgi:hypothetical protein
MTWSGREFGRFLCPQEVKQFVWRVAHNSLPLKMGMKRRHIDLETRCPVCIIFDEDGGHCFMKCKGVCQCWREMDMEMIQVKLLEKKNSNEFVKEILNFKLELATESSVLNTRP